MFEKLLDALLNLFDDVRDARELRLLQLNGDIRKAWGLSLMEIGKTCSDEGERLVRVRSGSFIILWCGARYAHDNRYVCGEAKNHSGQHSNVSGDRKWDDADALCVARTNDGLVCGREFRHQEEHYANKGGTIVSWEDSSSGPYVAPKMWSICGVLHPCVADTLCRKPPHSIDEPHSNGDVVWNWPETVHICSSQHNSSDVGWFTCRREAGHPGDHMGAGKRWAPEQAAPTEQPGVISTKYDD